MIFHTKQEQEDKPRDQAQGTEEEGRNGRRKQRTKRHNRNEKRGFSREQFARSHPGGALGKQLTLRVKDIMHTGRSMPIVDSKASLLDAIMKITETGLGFAIIVNDANEALGVFTDGDLRRLFETEFNVHKVSIGSFMNKFFKKVSEEKLAFDTLAMMRDLKINGLPVVDENNRVVGAVNLHDLLKLGFNL